MRKKICIAGLGLLGTSLAMALDRSRYEVNGWCRNPDTGKWVLQKEIIEKFYASPEEAMQDADLVCICLPIPVIIDFIRQYGKYQKPGALLTDIGSVKGVICKAAAEIPSLNFIGSHPMAGTEKSGPHAAFATLFNNADVFIVPEADSDPASLRFLQEFWESIHTHVRFVPAENHDKLVANTSHMLHIIASALSQSILDAPDADELRLNYAGCATGFRDTSRIASSSPAMWREICENNVPAIMAALDSFEARLSAMKESLRTGQFEDFETLFTKGRYLRDSWLCYKAAVKLPESITLCGIKHAGKSSAAGELARILALKYYDTDDVLVEMFTAKYGEKLSVREIYIRLGEEGFRKLEAEAIRSVTVDGQPKIIALGGGALSNSFLTEDDLKKLGVIVCLDVPDSVAFERILKKGLPPFLKDAEDPFAKFCAMNQEKRDLFRKKAHIYLTPAAFEQTPRDIALHILSLYKEKVL